MAWAFLWNISSMSCASLFTSRSPSISSTRTARSNSLYFWKRKHHNGVIILQRLCEKKTSMFDLLTLQLTAWTSENLGVCPHQCKLYISHCLLGWWWKSSTSHPSMRPLIWPGVSWSLSAAPWTGHNPHIEHTPFILKLTAQGSKLTRMHVFGLWGKPEKLEKTSVPGEDTESLLVSIEGWFWGIIVKFSSDIPQFSIKSPTRLNLRKINIQNILFPCFYEIF